MGFKEFCSIIFQNSVWDAKCPRLFQVKKRNNSGNVYDHSDFLTVEENETYFPFFIEDETCHFRLMARLERHVLQHGCILPVCSICSLFFHVSYSPL
jgi:hypothetical protein